MRKIYKPNIEEEYEDKYVKGNLLWLRTRRPTRPRYQMF